MRKKGIVGLIAIILVTMMLFGCSSTPAAGSSQTSSSGSTAPAKVYSLASASLGGTYYIVGTAVAEEITKADNNLTVNSVTAQGSNGNPLLIEQGEAELIMTNYLSGSKAIAGTGNYEKPINLAGICPLQYSIIQFFTFANSDINSIADLKGKNVAIGPAGGGGALLVESLLPYWGLSVDDIKASYISYADGTDALKDGKVAMNVPHGAPPLETVSSIAETDAIKIISMEDEIVDKVIADYPSYSKTTIPAGTYKGVDEDVTSVGIQDILCCDASLSNEEVYAITKAIYEGISTLKTIHPSLAGMTFEGYKNSVVPLHPGAKQFYDEMGIKYE